MRGLSFPDSPRIFVDGAAAAFREGLDLELSHWVPNHTPEKFKRNTSTEICLAFVKCPMPGFEYATVVNNHLDTDGVLAAFSLAHPEVATSHQSTLVAAAEAGDFNAWHNEGDFCFYLELNSEIRQHRQTKVALHQSYHLCFLKVLKLLQSRDYSSDVRCQAKAVSQSIAHNQHLTLRSRRFAAYLLNDSHDKAVIHSFDNGLELQESLCRFVRNAKDLERFKLVVQKSGSHHKYQLLMPEYTWAETPGLWNLPGKVSVGVNAFTFNMIHLSQLAQKLQDLETNPGEWILIDRVHPFSAHQGVKFPVILAFMYGSILAPSSISPDQVLALLTVWESNLE